MCPLLNGQYSFSHLSLGLPLSLCYLRVTPLPPPLSLTCSLTLSLSFSVALPLSLFFNSTSKYLIKFDLDIYMWSSFDLGNCIFCSLWRLYTFCIWTDYLNRFPWCIWVQRRVWGPEVTIHLLCDCGTGGMWSLFYELWKQFVVDLCVCGYFF